LSHTDHAGRAQLARPALELELEAIDRQQRRFSRLSLLAIIVSFVHIAAALALFSGAAWYEVGAALAMTALVDVATWALAGYFDYAARRRLARSIWIKATFGFALAISMFLNGAYLYAHRPPSLPGWMSIGIAGAFAVFVPMLIGVASLIRGELEDDRLWLQQQASLAPIANAPAAGPEPARTQPSRARTPRGELPAFANATPAGSRTATVSPVVPALAANSPAHLPEPKDGVRTQLPLPTTTFAPSSTNGAAGTAANGPAAAAVFATSSVAAQERVEPEPPAGNELFRPVNTNADTLQGLVNVLPAAGASATSPISTNDVPAIVAVLRSANVHEFASARALARICGWTSSSSGPKALKQLLVAGVVRETAGGFALVEPGGERTVNALAEPLASVAT
jgi:hypothetical protein